MIMQPRLLCTVLIVLLLFVVFVSIPLILLYTQDPEILEKLYYNDIQVKNENESDISTAVTYTSGESQESSEETIDSASSATISTPSLGTDPPSVVIPSKNACKLGQFSCYNSLDVNKKPICLDRTAQCNKIKDCPNGEDETRCTNFVALHKPFNKMLKNIGNRSLEELNKSGGHEYCTFNELFHDLCPCYLNTTFKVICKHANISEIPHNLSPNITNLNLKGNQITEINQENLFQYQSLKTLVLEDNRISQVPERIFEGLMKLRKIYLKNNQITTISEDTFYELNELVYVNFEGNLIRHFELSSFQYTSNLKSIHLSRNHIKLENQVFPVNCSKVEDIDLSDNEIDYISYSMFKNLKNLETLNLAHNQIRHISATAFQQNTELVNLDLSHNRIKNLHTSVFKGLHVMATLDISYNPMDILPKDIFKDLKSLQSLNLTGITINNIDIHHFKDLKKLEFIYFVKFSYCLFAPHVRICHPFTDGLSSLQHLLVYPLLRFTVWIVAFLTCVGNVVVLIWRTLSEKEDSILSLFIKNLSISDLMMGIYLVTIGVHDISFRDNYINEAMGWMHSWQCTFSGFIAVVSSELSVLIIALITVERYRCITANFRAVSKKNAKINIAAAWIISISLAFYPIAHAFIKGERMFYGTNSLCYPLHIDDPFFIGWEYSAIIFLGINFPAVIIIMTLYIKMFLIIKHDRKYSRPVLKSNQNDAGKEDAVLALRFFFIVLTDCLCWIPIVVIKIIALLSVPISPTIYAWVIVFILPINSALNPIIYTLAAPTELRRRIYKFGQTIVLGFECTVRGKKRSFDRNVTEGTTSSMFSQLSDGKRNGSVISMKNINNSATQTGSIVTHNGSTNITGINLIVPSIHNFNANKNGIIV